ncbi:uncharacterized protein LOC119650818 [Hermetia illucens]|uniref:uncharacterized protein LOC119650818 n=1 Tax=Hermetia illucens TaxID=343691 RepID=UPI0018CC322C|nr:uncharacterized protein LOC119650818 [Hermetia illucens]
MRAQDAVLLAQYMKEYEEVEDAWGECSVVFRQNIAGYIAAESSQRPAVQEAPDAGENVVRLERIKISSYGGDYTQWAAFHDLFKVMVQDNNKLSGVQKLQYLRASVNGKAEQLIRHLTLTETNYAPAWKLLKGRYNNKRAIGNVYMKGIWSLPTSTPASPICIKRILDTTEQFRANTESLGPDLVNLIMVYILQQKLDNESNSEWQKFIGSSNEIPTLNQFTIFLHQRFTILEAVQITQRKTVKVGVHSAQATGAVCRVCQGDHRISQCDTFLKSDIARRRELVASLRLGYNCLHEVHAARNCPSRKGCKLCEKKHNSMLHQASSNRAASSALPNPK